MGNIIIYPVDSNRLVQIEVSHLITHNAEAYLLGKDGEEIKRFPLLKGLNVLPLFEYDAGKYSLRIEAGQEVLVKQIQL